MELTVGEAIQVSQGLNALANIPLPAKLSYQIVNASKELLKAMSGAAAKEAELRKIYAVNITKTVGPADNEAICIDAAEFNNAMEAILAETIYLNWEPIKLSTLGDAKITPADMHRLSPLFVE